MCPKEALELTRHSKSWEEAGMVSCAEVQEAPLCQFIGSKSHVTIEDLRPQLAQLQKSGRLHGACLTKLMPGGAVSWSGGSLQNFTTTALPRSVDGLSWKI